MGFAAMLHSQNVLTGKITTSNNEPLPGVSVYASDLQKGTISNSDGRYSLSNLPTGKVTITFSYLGFTTRNETILLSDKETSHDIVLIENIHQMDEVIVATSFNRLQSQNVMKVENASMKSINQKGGATLIEGLATIPGVAQISTGTSIGKPVIRGLSSNRVLVYSQGVRLENQQFGDEHGLGLNDSGIESVEVIKGPASLLYGSDALGGVLYFNPEKFANANSVKADFSQKLFSNTLGTSSSFGARASTENWKFLIRGSYDAHSDYKIPDGEKVTNTRYNETDVKSGVGYGNSKFSSVLRYNFNQLDLGIVEDGIAQQSNSKKTAFPKQGVNNHILSLHNNIFFANSTLDADIGYVYNDRSEFEDSNIAALRMKLKTFSYDLKYHFPKFKNLEAIGGIQGMSQTNLNLGEEFLIPDATTNDFGIFGTAIYEWKSNVFQAGLRYDNRKLSTTTHGILDEENYFASINKSFDSFNASLGYKTDLNKNLVMRLNFASGFRAPNLAELTSNGVHEGTNRYEIGNNNLETEQNFQTDLNLEYKNSHFEFFANGFYNQVSNYIYGAPSGTFRDGNEVYNYVQNDAALYGGEAGIHFHPHPLDWLHLETSFETVTGKKNNGDYLPLIPANNWNNTIRTEFKVKEWLSEGFARLNLSTTFRQSDVSGVEIPSDGYTLVNFGIGGKVKIGNMAFETTLNGNNLFDERYIAHLSRLKPDNIPNIGRNIVVEIRFAI